MPDKFLRYQRPARRGRLALFFMALAALLLAGPLRGAEPVDFRRDVRPILARACFKCHGPDDQTRQGELRLDVREGALAPAESGEKAIVPGEPNASELMRRITATDADVVMPPPATKITLTAAQKQTLKQWIAEGAEYKPHWSFIAPQRPALPQVKQRDWPQNAIDYFVLARLEQEKLAPSAPADRYTLVRRVYLDLIGLPPTPAEADAFVNDKSPNAYEQLVDRLLASPAYGERWARRWLDLARYADTNGYEKDRVRSIWPYRDWVISALNRDLPFDQFTIEQLAGDMLPNASLEQRVATGFHRNTMINEEGGIDPLEFRYYSVVDRTNTTATTWLGLTLGCAQCHTHKYDPIPHREYYAMLAFLNNADEPELPVTQPDITARREAIEQRIAALKADIPNRFPVEEMLKWEVALPQKVVSAGKATTKIADDGSVLLSGENPEVETLTIQFSSKTAGDITGLKLEALIDPDLPSTGPGRTPHGNFVLTDISITAEIGEGGKAEPVKISQASADFEQMSFPAAHTLDGNPKTGWAIHGPGKWNTNRAITYLFEKPVSSKQVVKWTVTLAQQYGTQHTLGKFRISLAQSEPNQRPLPQRRQEHFERKYQAWLKETEKKIIPWTVLRPANATSNLPLLTVQPDASVLASGDQTKRDVFDLSFTDRLPSITAIRLEAIADDRLPKRGPGRIYYEGPAGDFFLSTFTAQVNGQNVVIDGALQSFASGGSTADKAIDADPQSGWSINGGQGKSHTAIFLLKEAARDVSKLDIQMVFERYYAAGLGRFRISVTSAPMAGDSVGLPPEINDALQLTAGQRSAEHEQRLRDYFLTIAPELAGARGEIEQLQKQMPEYPTTLALDERPRENPRPTFRMHRGEFLQPKEKVEAGVLAALNPLPEKANHNRLTFAKWLMDKNNPLTARVTVNRHWGAIFGRGLVRTTEDFGLQGELPSHPELLDYLAVEFRDRGWSTKDLHRLIVTSSTYRQASHVTLLLLERDPQNVLLTRGPRVRLEGELVRDNVLRISGLLSHKVGGPSVFPPQPASVTSEGTYGALGWSVSPGEDRYRRALYTFAKRTAPYAMLGTFDGPSGEACVPRREVSNTPLQALVLLNDEVFLEAAKSLGSEFALSPGDDGTKLAALFRRVLVRPPTTAEQQLLKAFLASQRERLERKELDAAALVGPGENATTRAAWTIVARSLLNLDETVTKE